MIEALNSVCLEIAPVLWTLEEQKLWSDYIRTTFDLGAQRCLQVKPVVPSIEHVTGYHMTLFKVPHHPLQSTTPPSLKYNTTLFKVPHRPLQSSTSPS